MPGRHDFNGLQRGHGATGCSTSRRHDPTASGGAAYPVASKQDALEIRTRQLSRRPDRQAGSDTLQHAQSSRNQRAAYVSGHSQECASVTCCRWPEKSRTASSESRYASGDSQRQPSSWQGAGRHKLSGRIDQLRTRQSATKRDLASGTTC